MIVLLLVGSLAIAAVPLLSANGWPPLVSWILRLTAILMFVYALSLLPTRLVISDHGISQRLLFSKSDLRWEDLLEWRHCDGGGEFETGELRERTKNRWHFIEFWVKDKTGKKHYFKRWLVFGQRSKQLADILRERGIEGG